MGLLLAFLVHECGGLLFGEFGEEFGFSVCAFADVFAFFGALVLRLCIYGRGCLAGNWVLRSYIHGRGSIANSRFLLSRGGELA